jgi:hypothetical protein
MIGVTTGGVRLLLRVEGACVLAAAFFAYAKFDVGWGTFAVYFLAPDVSFLGNFAGPSIGAIAYNSAHSYIGAVLVLLAGALLSEPMRTVVGIIWCAHIGMDRALGYGLKYCTVFGATHLGLIGRARPDSQPTPSVVQDRGTQP